MDLVDLKKNIFFSWLDSLSPGMVFKGIHSFKDIVIAISMLLFNF